MEMQIDLSLIYFIMQVVDSRLRWRESEDPSDSGCNPIRVLYPRLVFEREIAFLDNSSMWIGLKPMPLPFGSLRIQDGLLRRHLVIIEPALDRL